MKNLFSTFFLLLFSSCLMAQTGKVSDNLSMQSKILKMDRKYAIYLPPDYESSQRSYPVLYLLHGAGDDQTGWVQFGEVLTIADEAIKSGIIANDFSAKFPTALKQLTTWLKEGKLNYAETIVHGFDNIPQAFIDLFEGKNEGKNEGKMKEK
jgi:hypothetical protein